MTQMLAYTHPKISRDAFLAELKWHQDQDRIVAGAYESGTDETFKGCAVGCSLHSVKRVAGIKDISYADHAQYPVYLGIPEVLARLQDRIFEGISGEAQKTFPLRFSEAIAYRADLSGVFDKFIVRVLRDIALPAVTEKHSLVRTAIARVIAGFETQWANDTPAEARKEALNARNQAAAAAADAYAADAAASAASAAADAAAAASDAAYASAYAASAASYAGDAAYASAYAAYASASDAAYASAYAASAAAYAKMADILFQELAAAPVIADETVI